MDHTHIPTDLKDYRTWQPGRWAPERAESVERIHVLPDLLRKCFPTFVTQL